MLNACRHRDRPDAGWRDPSVVLPEPDSPTRPKTSPRRDRERDTVDGAHAHRPDRAASNPRRRERRGRGVKVKVLASLSVATTTGVSTDVRRGGSAGGTPRLRPRDAARASAARTQRTARAPPAPKLLRLAASRLRERAARLEPAAGGERAQVGQAARNGRQPRLARIEARDGRQQALCVGMEGTLEHLGGRAALHHLARVEDGHLVGDAADDARGCG